MTARQAFSLFEVAIALGLIAVAVGTVLLLFPVGIRVQQGARFRLLAAAKAIEMVDAFATFANVQMNMDCEAYNPWDVPVGYRNLTHDLETRLATSRNGVIPLPLAIARRLDSDGDQIARILDEGGYLYYSQPMATTGVEERTLAAVADNQTQRLVFAVSGYAQLNAIGILPQKSWPYYAAYPSPPGYGFHRHDSFLPTDADRWLSTSGFQVHTWEGEGGGGSDAADGSCDTDIASVALAFRRYNFSTGFPDPSAPGPTFAGALAFVQTTLAYAQRKAVPTSFYDPQRALWPKPQLEDAVADAIAAFDALNPTERWKPVQAMRFLSYAATCVTRWKSLAELGGQPSSGSGVDIPAIDVGGTTSPPLTLTHDMIVYYHELSLRLAMRYAACQTYDWGAPRPIQRAIMTDYPLLEWDVANPDTLRGTIFGEAIAAEQWRPIAGQPITNLGRSYAFPDRPVGFYPDRDSDRIQPQPLWGNQANFTLTKPFLACERCREIIFWAVDWQSYEDCETAQSAPLDASKLSFPGPVRQTVPYGSIAGADRDLSLRQRLDPTAMAWVDHHNYAFRNPEKNLTFVRSVGDRATGGDVTDCTLITATDAARGDVIANVMTCYWDHGSGSPQIDTLLGRFGADRNFNKRLDRGPLPASTRLRAVTVSRYNFYDPRVSAILR